MSKIDVNTTLAQVLKDHEAWLENRSGSIADLSAADLSGANLSRADLSGANLPLEKTQIVPEKGEFIRFKKSKEGVIIELLIKKDAQRVNCIGSRKCRASKVKILRFIKSKAKILHSKHDATFTYKVGQVITIKDFNDLITEECAQGIHFFITKKEAEEY